MKFEKLKNILSIHKGRKVNILDEETPGAKRVLQIDDLRNDKLIKYTTDTNGIWVSKRDLMIVWDGANAGTIGYGKEGYIGSTIAALKLFEPQKYNSAFLGLFLQRQFRYFQKNSTGATIPHINRKSLENLLIPALNIDEQFRIATVISKVENLINLRRESITLLDSFLKNTFTSMFGNYQKIADSKLNLLGENISYLTSGSRGWAQYYSETGAKFLRIQNIGGGTIRTDNLILVTPPPSAEAERTRVKEGDLIISITADLGRSSVIPKDFGEGYINQHLALIRLNNNINPIYAAYFYNMPFGNNAIQKKNRASVKAGLNFNDIRSFPILIPKRSSQDKFAEIVSKIETIKKFYLESLRELESLFNSISQRAFNGKLDLSALSILYDEEYSSTDNDRTEPKPIDFERISVVTKEATKEKTKIVNKGTKQPTSKILWEQVSSQQIAEWIKDKYPENHFSSEMLTNFLKNEHVTFPDYYSSEDLKKKPHLNGAEDLKSFVFSAISNQNPFVKFEQHFYNAEQENFVLELTTEDYELIQSREPKERSGIYFRISKP